MTGVRLRAARSRPVRAAAAAVLAILSIPAAALAHRLSGVVDAPLPLVAYLAGAAVAVGLSFAFLALSEAPGARSAGTERTKERTLTVPRGLRLVLRLIGVAGWLWIVVQAIVGGASDADVSSLFLWVYGWIGLAIVSALLGPVWSWIDPFTTLFDIIAALGRRLGPRPGTSLARYPHALATWPAVAGFAVFVWLELVVGILGGRLLGLVLIGYTIVTLAAMAHFGRNAWRAGGETFSVWFGLLGRLAPLAHDGSPDEGRLLRRGFGSGLTQGPWSTSLLVLVVLAAGSIIYDGLSQTPDFVRLFGIPGPSAGTVILAGFMALLVVALIAVARSVGVPAVTAGLIPVACGYLIAHYLTTLLIDGQRIVVALSDPLQQGWDLFGTAFHEPGLEWLPTSLIWGLQLAAVVGGHIVGAWAGHAVAQHRTVRGRLGQLPLALAMVTLTTATLWSLGQNLVFGGPAAQPTGATRSAAISATEQAAR